MNPFYGAYWSASRFAKFTTKQRPPAKAGGFENRSTRAPAKAQKYQLLQRVNQSFENSSNS